MNALPPSSPDRRAPRVRPAEITPAVLRFEDGRRTQGRLELVSLTGGLLQLRRALSRDCRFKLMFVTPSGPVSGTAEMLEPLSPSQQPFRFISLEHEDQRRLRETAPASCWTGTRERSCSEPGNSEQDWIEKYRATLEQQHAPKTRLFSTLLAAATLAVLCLGSMIYFFGLHVK